MAMKYPRLTHPLVRDGGELQTASWDEALDHAAAGFRKALVEGTSTGI
ncbi:MAG TPA: molybdopterin-dependent oxidoreductase, partial [Gaiellaceae bacterium]|nr:molybdopterin-dependent oxidoreductase [Gaiellaceae bacterium]